MTITFPKVSRECRNVGAEVMRELLDELDPFVFASPCWYSIADVLAEFE
jgi:hypothetical protein